MRCAPHLVIVLALALAVATDPARAVPGADGGPVRPNVVVLMTDDQTLADMASLPQTKSLIGDEGATFTRSYVSYPLCCPSRATYLTGRYAHNHNVRTNAPPKGGFEKLDPNHTLPVWLRAAGYDTIHIGKYLNGYGLRHPPVVPRGWSEWHGTIDKSTYQMWGYKMFEDGAPRTYGSFDVEDPALYQTDVLRDKAVGVIEEHAEDRDPFFLSVAFVAPHGEVVSPGHTTQPFIRPAPRHEGHFATLPLPAALADEADVSDKPRYIRRLSRVGPSSLRRITQDFRARRESLLAVDDAVVAIMDALGRTGRLQDTFILFTSDNGFLQGEHRIPKGKYFAYDPSSHVPLMIRGPGVLPGTISGQLSDNTDLAATILDATGASADTPLDGISLLPYARHRRPWTDRTILHEGLVDGDIDRDGTKAVKVGNGPGVYWAVRTDRFLYVHWKHGEQELYDRAHDPLEHRSLHRERRYHKILVMLRHDGLTLRNCVGAACRRGLPRLHAAVRRLGR